MIAAWSPTAGTKYTMGLYWKASTGAFQLYINGVPTGSIAVLPYTRTGVSRVNIGRGEVYSAADGEFDNFILWNTQAFSTTHSVPYNIPSTIYAANKVDGPNFTYTGVGTVQSVDNGSVVESGAPRYIVGGQYWNGSAWAASNGTYAQANSFATALANFGSFDAGGGGILPWSIVFDDSNTLSSVDSFSVEVTGQIYPTSNPNILATLGLGQTVLRGMSEVSIKSGSDEIKYTLRYSGVDHYISGGTLVASNGTYAQASTAAEIDAACPLDIDPDAEVQLRSFIHSENGQTTPELESVTLEYDLWVSQVDPGECVIYGYVLDNMAPVQDAVVTIKTLAPFFRNGNLISVNEAIVSGDNGYYSLTLPVTAPLQVKAVWTDAAGKTQKKTINIVVPNEASKRIDLAVA